MNFSMVPSTLRPHTRNHSTFSLTAREFTSAQPFVCGRKTTVRLGALQMPWILSFWIAVVGVEPACCHFASSDRLARAHVVMSRACGNCSRCRASAAVDARCRLPANTLARVCVSLANHRVRQCLGNATSTHRMELIAFPRTNHRNIPLATHALAAANVETAFIIALRYIYIICL